MSKKVSKDFTIYIVCHDYAENTDLSAYLSLKEADAEAERIMSEWAKAEGIRGLKNRDDLERAYAEAGDNFIIIEPVKFTVDEIARAFIYQTMNIQPE